MINRALRLIRQFHKLKQTELAEKLGISKSYLCEIETGKKPVSFDTIERYSKIFDIPTSSLVFFSEVTSKQGAISEKFRKSLSGKILNIMEWYIEQNHQKAKNTD